MLRRTTIALFLTLTLVLLPRAAVQAQDNGLSDQVRTMALHATEGIEAAEAQDATVIAREVLELEAYWSALEDGVRTQQPAAYLALEEAIDDLADTAAQTPLDVRAVQGAFAHVAAEVNEAAELLASAPATAAGQTDVPQTLPALLQRIDGLYEAAEAADLATSRQAVQAIVLAWPALEGDVAARAPDAYTAIEAHLGQASAAVRGQPVDWHALETSAASLRATIAPLLEVRAYTAFDAAAIILREGLEALLVVAALLTFLRRANHADKQRWVWLGAGVGVLLSIAVAVLLQAIFSQVAAGRNRELIEGVTGLVAAAMLFYVSYWLHSTASLNGWRRYIDTSTTRALARGNLIGLALLAMMAIFREGAETAVFYLGIAPAIALQDLLLGIGAGVAVLAVAAWLILVAGVKLPLRLFFQVAGILVFYLGFKFVGTGIHALQVAGAVPTTPIPWLPAIPFFGIYPTVESLLPQVIILGAGIGFYVYGHVRQAALTTEVQAA
ncbi:MAG TPA: FTR1 family protein [Caldilinea sp.]|nr:FTR1 family protein [Caldilinea sp.]